MKPTVFKSPVALLRRLLLAAACAFSTVASAGPADISSLPLSTMTEGTVRPNLMFILDDSGSMAWNYLPDQVGNDANRLCYGYFNHNRIFFNPGYVYPLPSDGNGGNLGAASFTAAKNDGFAASSGTVNLSIPGNLPTRYLVSSSTDYCTGGAPGCTSSNNVDSAGRRTIVSIGGSGCRNGRTCTRTTAVYQHYYYTTLNANASNNCTNANYTAVTSSTSWTAEQRQNYANWYQYYRTRMLMMRSASGLAFDAIDPTRFRVGFSTISDRTAVDGNEFLHVRDYDAPNQKAEFFRRLYGIAPNGSTPLRSGLHKAGQYFAKRASGQNADPMQYSCQRNYALLSTDGYWNTGLEPGQPYYIPKRLDGTTAIGDLDGVTGTPRPMFDAVKSKNSLADIAKYYYDTDLRTTALDNCAGSVANQDVCTNRVAKAGDTRPVHQNMTTFTLGLGIPGVYSYRRDYLTAKEGDYWDILNGVKNWPDPLSSTNGGYADTGSSVTARIDDLWHAAVNGGGVYYSAGNPDDLVTGLTDALNNITADTGASSAAATSTLRPVPGDDWVFLPSYQTKTWTGDIAGYKFTIDPDTGAVSVPTTPVWNAAKKLGTNPSRKVLFYDGTALKDFVYDNLGAHKAYFDDLCGATEKLSQCNEISAGAKGKVTGANVVDYLRGKNQYEMSQTDLDNRVFRTRQFSSKDPYWTPLGDIVNSSPVYVRKPPFKYKDAGYAAYREAQKDRIGVVYVGANDGMLHAFRASDGEELWAFVPTAVMREMYRLADVRYDVGHRFYVDATPVVADVYHAGAWRTILIGGLGAGGRGYYALDVTDPQNPRALWEFTDTQLGLTYGNPVVGKNKAGTWIVAFTSGYNNINPGDGNGRLWVLNAVTGALMTGWTSPMETNTVDAQGQPTVHAGTALSPNNIGPINGWVETESDNTIEYFYGGDMQGNIWRFDYDNRVGGGARAYRLGTAQGPDGKIQPITVAPLLGEPEVGSGRKIRVIGVGTGRYLGTSDLGDKSVQSLYVLHEKLDNTDLGNLRGHSGMVRQTMNSSHVSPTTQRVDWDSKVGWFIDFDQTAGERVNVEMDLQLNPGMITLATTVPTPTPCSPGGTSWLYFFRLDTGTLLASEESQNLIVGFGNVVEKNDERMATISVGSDGSIKRTAAPLLGGGSMTPGTLKRTSWRELIN